MRTLRWLVWLAVSAGWLFALSGQATPPAWTATGEGTRDYFGCAVGAAGDVNGDGYADVIVGADGYSDSRGRAYVYTGGAGGLSAAAVFTATGQDANDHFGYAVGTAGDVNGDGYADVVVGAYHHGNFAGRVYVYAGGPEGLSATPMFTATGQGKDVYLGRSVRTAGDVNGDGYDDVIVGGDRYKLWTGRAYVYAGSARGLSATPIFTATGEGGNNHFGYAVGTAGDVNGDGYADVIVGAYQHGDFTGRVYVYAGGAGGLRATPIFTATGQGQNTSFGRAVGTAGDVNGDGYADVVVGANGYSDFMGRAYVYAGSARGLSATPIFTATGQDVNSHFGYAVGSAGDVNGDGHADVIVGAYHHGDFAGRAYVYAGRVAGASPPARPGSNRSRPIVLALVAIVTTTLVIFALIVTLRKPQL
jgi:hypothetical protein